jgi:hypothetical protein
MKTTAFVFGLILFGLTGCKDPGADSSAPPPAGRYEYYGYDSTGTPIVQGWFTIDLSDSTNLIGEWQFTQIGEAQNIGPQIGKGKLSGGFRNDTTLWLGLNPEYMDNNVILNGTLHGNEYRGRWMYISFVGLTNSGTFIAVRK